MTMMTDRPSTRFMVKGMGDLKLTWDPENTEIMKQIIQKKMDEGYVFLIEKRTMGKKTHEEMKTIDELGRKRIIIVKDADISGVLTSGAAQIVKVDTISPGPIIETEGVAASAAEAASTSTVAVPPRTGG